LPLAPAVPPALVPAVDEPALPDAPLDEPALPDAPLDEPALPATPALPDEPPAVGELVVLESPEQPYAARNESVMAARADG
jgi:hypothetical protein